MWALYDVAGRAPGIDPGARLVLLVLADVADESGRGAFPGVATICRATGLSRATVYRRLSDLESAGLIRPGDPRHVAHYRADRRPRVWDLALDPVDNSSTTGSQAETPTPHGVSHGVSENGSRGLTVETRTVKNLGTYARGRGRARPAVDNDVPTPVPAEFGSLCEHGWSTSAAGCPHCPGGRLAHLDTTERAQR